MYADAILVYQNVKSSVDGQANVIELILRIRQEDATQKHVSEFKKRGLVAERFRVRLGDTSRDVVPGFAPDLLSVYAQPAIS